MSRSRAVTGRSAALFGVLSLAIMGGVANAGPAAAVDPGCDFGVVTFNMAATSSPYVFMGSVRGQLYAYGPSGVQTCGVGTIDGTGCFPLGAGTCSGYAGFGKGVATEVYARGATVTAVGQNTCTITVNAPGSYQCGFSF